ncbi:hypothetical protein EVD24_05375 [Brucella abortus]|nr:hypothetical protein EVD24_05375 [Brucella abortus]
MYTPGASGIAIGCGAGGLVLNYARPPLRPFGQPARGTRSQAFQYECSLYRAELQIIQHFRA